MYHSLFIIPICWITFLIFDIYFFLDEYGLPVRRKRLRPSQKGSVLNWMEFIPPPPDHPPSERGSPTHSATNLRNPYAMRHNIHSQVSTFSILYLWW